MTNKKYRVCDLFKYDYSEIREYIDEYHTDRPLRNDEIISLLNEQDNKIKELMNELAIYKYYVEFVPISGDEE